jgi:chromosome partitioning protein
MAQVKQQTGGQSRVIALASQKGGVGKTTTAANLGVQLARLKRRTLIVDFDPQASASQVLGMTAEQLNEIGKRGASIYDAVCNTRREVPLPVWQINEYLDLVPSHIDLAAAEQELTGRLGHEKVLAERLKPLIGHYEFILIDCPPSLGNLTIAALTAATEVLIPIPPEAMALQAVARLRDTIALVQRHTNERLTIAGMVVTIYDKRRSTAKQLEQALRDTHGPLVFETVIRDRAIYTEDALVGAPTSVYAPGSPADQDYAALAAELVRRGNHKAPGRSPARRVPAATPGGEE